MVHPLLTHLATQPGLFAEHAGAYVELASAEAGQLGRRWLQRGVLVLVAVACGALSLGLAGVAAIVAAALPWHAMPAPWALWAVPMVPAALAAACAWASRNTAADEAFPLLRHQMQADARMFREVDAAA